jgi:3-hydroxyisobutyrate dehydrogenase-like beta-hydroxyacid dehydrogenase
MATVGFVGLGTMGGRMVTRLLAAGHAVVGYNRNQDRARPLVALGMRLAGTPREVAQAAPVVLSMVTNDDAVRAVAEGPDGLLAGLGRDSIWAEMSTVSPETTRALAAQAAARGAAMLDAPVSGSSVTIEQGRLTFMVGGDAAVLERVRPILLAIGPNVVHVGELGLAVSMKIAVNLGLATQMLSFCESVALAEKAGIARERAVEVLLKSVVASPMVAYRAAFVLEKPAEPLFDVPMMQKDLALALGMGRRLGVPLPTTSVAQEWLSAARGLGLGDYDFAVVFDVIARLSGLPPSAAPGAR